MLEYLDAKLHERIGVADLATVANVSPFHLARLFRATFGDSPWRYVTACRVARARALLEHAPHLNVSEIALEVGFGSAAHLASVFRSIVGVSPSVYRTLSSNTTPDD